MNLEQPPDPMGSGDLTYRDQYVRVRHYSTILRTAFLLSLVETAFRMVRMALAVRPSFPMMRPMSSFATVNLITRVSSSISSAAWTCAGSSTRDFAMVSTSAFMTVSSAHVEYPAD